MAANIDWALAEELYISDPSISTRSLAKRLGVSHAAITKHSKPGQWVKKRGQFLAVRQAKFTERVALQQAKSTAEIVRETEEEAHEFITLARSALQEFRQQDGKAPDVREDAHKFEAVCRAWERARKMVLLLRGLPTERSEVADTRTGLEEVPDDKLEQWYEGIYRRVQGDGKGFPRTAHPEDAVE